jgi:hypothetical protein
MASAALLSSFLNRWAYTRKVISGFACPRRLEPLGFFGGAEAFAARRHKYGNRCANQARDDNDANSSSRARSRVMRRVFKQLAPLGGRARWRGTTKAERTAHARRMVLARESKRAAASLAVLLALVLGISDVRARGAPRDINVVVGTTPALVVPPDNGPRGAISFVNPSITSTVAVCPTTDRGGKPFLCAVEGAGSVTLRPLDSFSITLPDVRQYAAGGWNAVADAPNSPLTILDYSP